MNAHPLHVQRDGSDRTYRVRAERDCEICGKHFVSYNPNPRFCSTACYGKSMEAPIDLAEAIRLYESGHTQCEVAVLLGVTQRVICNAFRRAGYKCRIAAKRDQCGAKNSTWKGGQTITKAGYRLIYQPEHPRAQSNGYIFEHILVMERICGRHLIWHGPSHPDTEIVHHRDENGLNNDPSNLQLTTYGEHMRIHRMKPSPVKYCLACGALLTRKQYGKNMESTDCFRRRQHCDPTCMGITQQRRNALRRGGDAR